MQSMKLNTEFLWIKADAFKCLGKWGDNLCSLPAVNTVHKQKTEVYLSVWWHSWVTFSFMVHYKLRDLFSEELLLSSCVWEENYSHLFPLGCCILLCFYWLILFDFLSTIFQRKIKIGLGDYEFLSWSSTHLQTNNFFSSTEYLICIVFILPAKPLIEALYVTRLKIDPLRDVAQSLHYNGSYTP